MYTCQMVYLSCALRIFGIMGFALMMPFLYLKKPMQKWLQQQLCQWTFF